jgi:threonine dehydrogenase-like Zn-dependent dehydrogenase
MLAYTYEENGKFVLKEKEKPTLQSEDDAIVRVTLASICSSDLHIKHGAVPRAVPGITVGHEMVGIVEETGRRVTKVKPGDRVTVNVETFCGHNKGSSGRFREVFPSHRCKKRADMFRQAGFHHIRQKFAGSMQRRSDSC